MQALTPKQDIPDTKRGRAPRVGFEKTCWGPWKGPRAPWLRGSCRHFVWSWSVPSQCNPSLVGCEWKQTGGRAWSVRASPRRALRIEPRKSAWLCSCPIPRARANSSARCKPRVETRLVSDRARVHGILAAHDRRDRGPDARAFWRRVFAHARPAGMSRSSLVFAGEACNELQAGSRAGCAALLPTAGGGAAGRREERRVA